MNYVITHRIQDLRSLYPLPLTVDTVCAYSPVLRFQAAAQRRVPQFPSTASQLPAVLCALVHVYYSSSVHFSYIFNKTSEDDINIKPKHSSRKTSALLYSITLYYYHQSGQQDLNPYWCISRKTLFCYIFSKPLFLLHILLFACVIKSAST